MTLSTPVKVFALAALALVLGLGGVVLVLGRSHHPAAAPAVSVAAPVQHAAVVTHQVAAPKHHAARVKLDPNVPLIVRRALERHPVAVVAIYSSRVAGDRAVLDAARKGARLAHAGFVAADVSREQVAFGVAGWSDSIRVPAVVVARRPGTVVFGASGTTDAQTVAQAVTSSK